VNLADFNAEMKASPEGEWKHVHHAFKTVTWGGNLGVRTVGRLQVILTSLKVVTVVAILVLGLGARGLAGAQSSLVVSPAHDALSAFLTALVPVMAAYNGFQHLGLVGGEVLNPRKNLPRAAILGTSLVVALYLLVNWVYFHLLTFAQVSQSQHVASDAVARLLGDVGAKWLRTFAFKTLSRPGAEYRKSLDSILLILLCPTNGKELAELFRNAIFLHTRWVLSMKSMCRRQTTLAPFSAVKSM
jgi:Amino acid permease